MGKPAARLPLPVGLTCTKCGGKLVPSKEKNREGWVCENNDWAFFIPSGKLGVVKKAWYKTTTFINGWKTAGGIVMAGLGSFGIVAGPAGAWLQIAGYIIAGISVPTVVGGGIHKVVKKKNSIKNKEGGKVSWLDAIIEILNSLKEIFVKGGEQ